MKQLRQAAIVTAAACALAIMSGCETPGDTALLGGLLGGMAPYAKTAQGAASMAAMGSAASGYANAQAGRSQVTVNNAQPSQSSGPAATINYNEQKMNDGSVYTGLGAHGADGLYYPQGWGRIRYADGRSYVGDFVKGRRDGQGTMEQPDGRRWEGIWVKGRFDRGKFTNSRGSSLEVVWNAEYNSLDSTGTEVWPDGTKYVGEWKYGGKSSGTITWKDGQEYRGDWKIVKGKPDLPDGEGTMTWPDGRKYVGEFRDGKMHGLGKMTYADGRIEEGVWKQDEFTGKQAVSGKSDNKPQTATSSGKQGTLTVDSVVADCEVFVDGSFMGNTPAKLRLSEGEHSIEVKKDGYKSYKKDVTVSEGSELTLRPSLQKE